MIELLNRRIYDIAAVTDKKVIVRHNGMANGIKTFQQYVDLYIGGKDKTPRLYEEGNERWEYCVCLSPYDEFTQVSFVNGIYTGKGGKHVEYIVNQIVKKVTAYILAKKKVTVKPAAIKEQLMIFLRCDIENPAFDSQTKDYMNTPVAKFGSTCTVSDKFIEKLAKMGVMSTACQLTEVKKNQKQQQKLMVVNQKAFAVFQNWLMLIMLVLQSHQSVASYFAREIQQKLALFLDFQMKTAIITVFILLRVSSLMFVAKLLKKLQKIKKSQK